MNLKIVATLSALSIFALSSPSFAGSSMHVDGAKNYCKDMISAGEAALDHGGQGHADVALKNFKKMVMHGRDCVKHGQEGIDAGDASKMTKMHGPEGLKHVKEAVHHAEGAVKHGEKGHAGAMMEHGTEAMMHGKEGVKHVNEMN